MRLIKEHRGRSFVQEGVEISIIVPVHNEAANAPALAREIADAFAGRAFELIFVDDGSSDDTRAALLALKPDMPRLRVLAHRRNAGQSRAVWTGIQAARAPILAICDGDGQNDPKDLPRLIAHLLRPDAPANLSMVQGVRRMRRDEWRRIMASAIGNFYRNLILRDGSADSACGMKALKRAAALRLPYFDHMHRYMPALLQAQGDVVEHLDVAHRPRQQGRSHYTNLGRLIVGVGDVFGVAWLMRRRRATQGEIEL
ncbi:MAG TPA: dolichol-phosphate mannosyltransferase [Hyphomonadaceae bacterium]|nr:dolichol-phosphate mannosyltransferase [Hyphomonadaceae bacterium]